MQVKELSRAQGLVSAGFHFLLSEAEGQVFPCPLWPHLPCTMCRSLGPPTPILCPGEPPPHAQPSGKSKSMLQVPELLPLSPGTRACSQDSTGVGTGMGSFLRHTMYPCMREVTLLTGHHTHTPTHSDLLGGSFCDSQMF
jgi:hypothetical protein